MCKNFDLMIKCLELTSSDNDAEALAAIRAANKLRNKLGLKWSSAFGVSGGPKLRYGLNDGWETADQTNYEKAKPSASDVSWYERHMREEAEREREEARDFRERRARATAINEERRKREREAMRARSGSP